MVYMGIALLVQPIRKVSVVELGGGGGELLHDKQPLGDAGHYDA